MMVGIYDYLGQKDKITVAVDSGLVKFPDNPDLLFSKALSDNDVHPAQNLAIYQKILSQEYTYKPIIFDYATVYNNIAWAYHLIGESSKGLPYSRKSVELNPSHDYSWETLGELCYDIGDYKGCIDAMKKCLKISEKYKEEANKFILLSKQKL